MAYTYENFILRNIDIRNKYLHKMGMYFMLLDDTFTNSQNEPFYVMYKNICGTIPSNTSHYKYSTGSVFMDSLEW